MSRTRSLQPTPRKVSQRRANRCRKLAPWLSAYADGELMDTADLPLRFRLEAHLERCANCADQVELWQQDAALLSVPNEQLAPSPWLARRVMQQIETEPMGVRPKSKWGLRWMAWRSLPVAVVVFGLLIGVAMRMEIDRQTEGSLFSRMDQFELGVIAASRRAPELDTADPDGLLDFDAVLRPEPSETSTGAGRSKVSPPAVDQAATDSVWNTLEAALPLRPKDR